MSKTLTDLTFRGLCGPDGWDAIRARWPNLTRDQQGFIAHMTLEPDRLLSAGQADWVTELVQRAHIDQWIEWGQWVPPVELPPPIMEPEHSMPMAVVSERAPKADGLYELFRAEDGAR